ncbi:MAG TPA: 3-keto-5-aminohexanoate cleavage protein [Chthoniobacterales bacterium]
MLLKAAINGRRTRSEHPAAPITAGQQAMEAARAVRAGAGAIHVHPRDKQGRESLAPDDVAASLEAIRASCPSVPIGVSTGAWIVPEFDRRLLLIEGWAVLPDFTAVNFHEPGALLVAQVLLQKGIALEAGIWNAEAAAVFRGSGLSNDCLRILIEPGQEAGNARERFAAVESVLEGLKNPRLLHGSEASAWTFIALAGEAGYDTRIGLEDTLTLPDGSQARDNGELVSAAWKILPRRQ